MSREPRVTSGRQVGNGHILAGIGVALGLGAAALLASRPQRRPGTRRPTRNTLPVPVTDGPGADAGVGLAPPPEPTTVAAQNLNRAAGVLAFSVLADSGLEHYRGSFHDPFMYAPLAVSALALGVSAHGLADERPAAHALRDATYGAAALVGIVGFGFHVYNVGKRPGQFSWQNLFYAAPLGAPMALTLSGLLGYMAERVRDGRPGEPLRFLGQPTGRVAAGITAAGLLGTTAEAALLHFRGAFHDPFMVLPVAIPPVAAALVGEFALGPRRRERQLTRWWLRMTAGLGLVGAAFHAYGIQREMGGWRNWSQNLLNGPPIPAPPSFTGLALAGLAALDLVESHSDA